VRVSFRSARRLVSIGRAARLKGANLTKMDSSCMGELETFCPLWRLMAGRPSAGLAGWMAAGGRAGRPASPEAASWPTTTGSDEMRRRAGASCVPRGRRRRLG
jgi:hypothetical protein